MKTILIKAMLVLGSLTSLFAAATEGVVNPSAPIVVVALAKVKPGSEEAFKKEANTLVLGTRKQHGVISYTYNQSIEDITEFAFEEHYQTMEDFNAHFNSVELQTFFKAVSPLFEAGYPQIRKYQEIEN